MENLGDESDEPDTSLTRWWTEWVRTRVLRVANWMLGVVGIRREGNRRIGLLDVMNGVRVRDLMTHRTDMKCVDQSAIGFDVLRECLSSDVTNWLVIENHDRDRIVGMLDVTRLMMDVSEGIVTKPVSEYVRSVERLLDANTVSDVMDILVGKDVPLIVLMDEYGGTAGVVTKSDVMRVLYARLRSRNTD